MIDHDIDEERIDAIDRDPGRENVQGYLEDYSGDHGFEYILRMHALVENAGRIRDPLRSILADTTVAAAVRFSAFYALSIHHYKNWNVDALEDLHEEYGSEFEGDPFYRFLHGIMLRERDDPGDLRNALRAFDEAVEEYPENPGVLKGAANGYLTAAEKGVAFRERDELLERAESCIRAALDRFEYPEYYEDLGRLYKLRGEYESAENAFERAIELESDRKANYGVAVAGYQYRKALVQLAQLEDQYKSEISDVQAELDNIDQRSEEIVRQFQTTVIQSISFFTGVVALVVTFVDVALSFSVLQAAQLVTVLTGGIVLAFGGMTAILPSEISLERVAILYATGLLLFAVGGGWMVLS